MPMTEPSQWKGATGRGRTCVGLGKGWGGVAGELCSCWSGKSGCVLPLHRQAAAALRLAGWASGPCSKGKVLHTYTGYTRWRFSIGEGGRGRGCGRGRERASAEAEEEGRPKTAPRHDFGFGPSRTLHVSFGIGGAAVDDQWVPFRSPLPLPSRLPVPSLEKLLAGMERSMLKLHTVRRVDHAAHRLTTVGSGKKTPWSEPA